MEQDPTREDLSNVYLLFTWGKVFFTHARSETLIHGVKLSSP